MQNNYKYDYCEKYDTIVHQDLWKTTSKKIIKFLQDLRKSEETQKENLKYLKVKNLSSDHCVKHIYLNMYNF